LTFERKISDRISAVKERLGLLIFAVAAAYNVFKVKYNNAVVRRSGRFTATNLAKILPLKTNCSNAAYCAVASAAAITILVKCTLNYTLSESDAILTENRICNN
jgi:hypothetical protein